MKIKRVRLLDNKFFVVTGPHDAPIGGPFTTRADAKAWLKDQQTARDERGARLLGRNA